MNFKLKILDIYIGKNIIINVFMVLMVLMSLIFIFTLIGEVSSINESYTIEEAFIYVFNKIPKQTYDFFPMAVLVGSLIGLGSLASRSELVVMRAGGFSVKQIIAASMYTGVILMVGVMLLGEFVVPVTEKKALEMKRGDLSKKFTSGLKGGIWVKNAQDIVHVQKVWPDKSLQDITIYTEKDNKLLSQKWIKRAEFKDDYWHLFDVKKTDYTSFPLKQTTLKTETVKTLLDLNLFKVLIVPPEILPINELSLYVDYLIKNNLDSGSYAVAFWQKVLSPFSVLIMLVLTIPFVFSSQRHGGAGSRILVGCVIGIGYLVLIRIVSHLGLVYGVPALISVATPMALSAIIAIYYAKKIH